MSGDRPPNPIYAAPVASSFYESTPLIPTGSKWYKFVVLQIGQLWVASLQGGELHIIVVRVVVLQTELLGIVVV